MVSEALRAKPSELVHRALDGVRNGAQGKDRDEARRLSHQLTSLQLHLRRNDAGVSAGGEIAMPEHRACISHRLSSGTEPPGHLRRARGRRLHGGRWH